MSKRLDTLHVIAEDGSVITGDVVKEWLDAYEAGHLPDGYVAGKVQQGRPRIYNDKMDTLTIRIPHNQKVVLATKAKEHGMSTSAYARSVLAGAFAEK